MTSSLHDQLQQSLGTAYRIERELGRGGMSRVFLAKDERLRRRIVVKVLPPELAAGMSIERFEREILLAAALTHPHIVPILAAGETDGLPYYLMPYLDGESLRARLARGPLPVAEAISILRDVARALEFAHGQGVVHRDIKPANIVLANGAAVVLDFGIAKAVERSRAADSLARASSEDVSDPLTALGVAIGTPAYMAPEQAVGDPGIDHRADLYALGVVAFEMLAGRTPFGDRPAPQLVAAHITEPAPSLVAIRHDAPREIAACIQRCLEKDPASRPQSAAELLAALAGNATGPLAPRRARTLTRVGAAVVLALAAAGAVFQRMRTTDTSDVARAISIAPLGVVGDTSAAYFAQGMTDELAGELARIPGLTVRLKRGAGFDAPSDATLSGNVQRAGDSIRVQVRLTDASNGILWQNDYVRATKDVFAVQQDIARTVASHLSVGLGDAAVARIAHAPGTRDAAAYDLYMRGRYAAATYTEASLRDAIRLYDQAIARDGSFARAWAGIADAWTALGTDFVPPKTAIPNALSAATRATSLDDSLAEAHVAQGNAMLADWRPGAAVGEFTRAIALDSASGTTHYYAASALIALGKTDEAIREAHAASQLDPQQANFAAAVALANLRAGRTNDALSAATAALRIDSTSSFALTMIGDAQRAANRPREALTAYALRGAPESPYDYVGPALAHAAIGHPDSVRCRIDDLRELSAIRHVPGDAFAVLYAQLGRADSAFAWLQRAYDEKSPGLVTLAIDADWAPLRSDSRFQALVHRVQAR